MKKFFKSSSNLDVQEIHVTHKCKGAFFSWNMKSLSEGSSFNFDNAVVFDKDLYPGYENKKVNTKGSFPIFDSKTYIFRAVNAEKEDEAILETIDCKKGFNNGSLLGLTKENNHKKMGKKTASICRG